MSQSEEFVVEIDRGLEARLADLIIFRDQARRRIAELESTVATLEQTLSETRRKDASPAAGLCRTLSAPLLNQPFKENSLQQICNWNEELVDTVNELRGAILKVKTEAKMQIVVLKDEREQLRVENESLRRENDALKERVAGDVLRQRQTNRMEMALEKAKIASRVRAAGLRRLECMEGVLMETHDDLYFVQRFDAAKLPMRDVTFVIHVVPNVAPSHLSGEDFTMEIYQKLLLGVAKQFNGYHVCNMKQLEVFAFHSAIAGLQFAKECHVGVTNLPWPSRTTDIPFFAPVIDNGELLYNGPRMHTSLYACNPGSEVDPIAGRTVYYGPEICDAITTTLKGAPIGEIVANKAWVALFCKEEDIVKDTHDTFTLDMSFIRSKFGPTWSVIALEQPVGDFYCSIIPKSLERRRGLPPYYLDPSPRFPRSNLDVDKVVPEVIASMKGVTRLGTYGSHMLVLPPPPLLSSQHRSSLSSSLQQQQQQQQMQMHALHPHYQEGWVDGLYRHQQRAAEDVDVNCADVLSLYSLRKERGNIISLYKKLETVLAFHEQTIMEAEDWYLAHLQSINPNETVYVCTVDVGTDASWRKMTQTSMGPDEHYHMRDQISSSVLLHGKKNSGVYVSGNHTDIFTFAFRRPEHVLQFASQVYILVSQHCEASTKSSVLCLMRAGITMGKLHPVKNVYNSTSSTDVDCKGSCMILCRGKALILSGCLCDMARCGEILANADVMQAYYATKPNLSTVEYNVLKQGGRFLGSYSTLVDVYSVIPKSYAFIRQIHREGDAMVSGGRGGEIERESSERSVEAALRLDNSDKTCEEVGKLLLQQQQLMERAEGAMMAAEDTAWDITAREALRLPWPVLKGISGTYATSEVGFFFCEAMNVSTISRGISDELYKEILAEYNFVVKDAILAYSGFIAKTDSVSGYVVIFSEPYCALEAALRIQRRLVALDWPNKLKTMEATLYVQSIKTGVVLFNGLRAKMAVHVSSDYQCSRISRGEGEFVDVSGPAMNTLLELGTQATGGEILLTPFALSSINSSVHGSLLLLQVAVQVAGTCSSSSSKIPVASCVPRSLWERLDLFIPPAAPLDENTGALRKSPSKPRFPRKSNAEKMSMKDTFNSFSPLPPSCQAPWGSRRGALPSSALSSAQISLDDVVNYVRRELAISVDLSPYREGFLSLSRDVLVCMSNAFRMMDEGINKSSFLSPPLGAVPPATQRNVDSPTASRVPMALGRRTPVEASKRVTPVNVAPPLSQSDTYKGLLQLLETTLRGALSKTGRTLGGTGGRTSSSQFMSVMRTKQLPGKSSMKPRGSLVPIQRL